MTEQHEQTDEDDGDRPLTPDERKALRRMIRHEPEIVDVAVNFSHLGWLAALLKKVAMWTTAVVGGFIAVQTWKNGGTK